MAQKPRYEPRRAKQPVGWQAILGWLQTRQEPAGSRDVALELGISQPHAVIVLERMRLFGVASVRGRGPRGGRLYGLTHYGETRAKQLQGKRRKRRR
jgi:hypothetical protein